MHAPWNDLLANFSVAMIVVFGWINANELIEHWLPRGHLVVFGLWFGFGAIALMQLPFEVSEGVRADLRLALVSIACLFGGPVAGVIAGAVAGAYRAMLGGAGTAAGFVSLGAVAVISTLCHLLLRGRVPGGGAVVLTSLAMALAGLSGIFWLPRSIWAVFIPMHAPPITILNFTATAIAGLALVHDQRRRAATAANHMYRAIIEALPEPLNAKDLAGRFLAANPATAEQLRADDPHRLIGRTEFEFYPPKTAARFREDDEAMLARGTATTIEQRFARTDGSSGWLSTLKAPLRDEKGAITGIITLNRDITDLKRLGETLATSQLHLAEALDHMADGFVAFDRNGRLAFSNHQYRAIFPRTADLRVPGAHLRDILRGVIERGEEDIPPQSAQAWIEALCTSLQAPGSRRFGLADGRWLEERRRVTEDGGCLIVLSDVTLAKLTEASLLSANKQLDTMARTDALTGLMNRRAFDAALGSELARCAADGLPLSLLLIDVDFFKALNDTYGHPAGDACLGAIAACLKAALPHDRASATRYGGEEFAVILPDAGETEAAEVAERLRLAVRGLGIAHAGSPMGVVTVSVGAAVVTPTADLRASDIVRIADRALYDAKAGGRDTVSLSGSGPSNKVRRRAP